MAKWRYVLLLITLSVLIATWATHAWMDSHPPRSIRSHVTIDCTTTTT